MAKLPYMELFIGDWKKDPNLSMCSPQTRGIWIDMLCTMHELGRSGKVTGTVEQLCRSCRCSAAEMNAALAELDATGTADVSRRNDFVTVINRRMNREQLERVNTNRRVQNHRKKQGETDLKRQRNGSTTASSSDSSSPSGNDDDAKRPPSVASSTTFRSRHRYETLLEWARSLKGVRNPEALAQKRQISGDDDDKVDAWLESRSAPPSEPVVIMPGESDPDLLAQFKFCFSEKLNPSSAAQWIDPLDQLTRTERVIYIRVPDKTFADWIIGNYLEELDEVKHELGIEDFMIEFRYPGKL